MEKKEEIKINQSIANEGVENLPPEEDNQVVNDTNLEQNLKEELINEEKSSFFGKKSNKENKLKEKIEKLESEKEELNEKYLRLFSEFDNYKKRTNREKLELLSTASETVIAYILPIIDDFERAIMQNDKLDLEEVQNETLKEGFEIIYKKLLQVLKQFHVEEIPAKGEVFNTDLHEAVTHYPVESEEDKGKIMDVLTKGYKIKDKVIRFSKVVVGN